LRIVRIEAEMGLRRRHDSRFSALASAMASDEAKEADGARRQTFNQTRDDPARP
jgi:hypothetical protein